MAGLRDRLNALEEARRLRAADELRKRLRTVSDEEIARWVISFRRGEEAEESAPKALSEVEDLFERALGDWTNVSEGELERRCDLIVGELLETRRAAIRERVASLELEASGRKPRAAARKR